MNGFDRVARIKTNVLSGESHISYGPKDGSLDQEDSPRRLPAGAPSASTGFNAAILNTRMTLSSFIETKFIPEHVQHKTLAGQTHYQAMLKHVIRPESVQRMFNPRNANARLQSVADWPYLDDLRLCDLTAEHVRRLVAAAFACDYSWQTVKHIKNVAFAIIAHAQQEDCFHGPNPVSQVKLPPKTHRATPDLSIDQTRAILPLLPSLERHVALFTLSTGMNIQEICNLQWKHVNLTESSRALDGELIPPYCIAVRMQWNRGGLGDTKHGRNRNIPIPSALFEVLADWARGREASNAEEFVLVSDTGRPVSSADLRSARLLPIGRKLGMPWLSWRVLCRAHVVLLSEFRPQLDYLIGNAGLRGAAPPAQGNEEHASESRKSSDTIRPKFSPAVLAPAAPLGWQL